MFITREAALEKLNAPDNPFSPSRKGSSEWGRAIDKEGDDAASPLPSSNKPTPPDAPPPQSATPEDADGPSPNEIRDLLSQVDPRGVRRGPNLRGNIEAQAAIGQTSMILGQRLAGNLFDRSVPQTAAYEHGHGMHRSAYGAEKGNPKPELVERLSAFKEKLAYAAGRVLEKTLDNLDEDKIGAMKKATSISRVAKDMAVIMDKVSKSDVDDNSVHFHIYRPDMRSVNAYETVKINGGTTVSPTGGLIDILPRNIPGYSPADEAGSTDNVAGAGD